MRVKKNQSQLQKKRQNAQAAFIGLLIAYCCSCGRGFPDQKKGQVQNPPAPQSLLSPENLRASQVSPGGPHLNQTQAQPVRPSFIPQVHVYSVFSSDSSAGLSSGQRSDPVSLLNSPERGAGGDQERSFVTRSHEKVVFHHKFFLQQEDQVQRSAGSQSPTPHWSFFFAWDARWDQSQVNSGFYTHFVYRNSQWLGNGRPKPVWFDGGRNLWFIPFFDLFRNSEFYSEGDLDLEDLQVIRLDLILASGQRVQYEIQFQVEAPLPSLRYRSLTDALQLNEKSVGNQVVEEGQVIEEEEWVNPKNRPFELWIKPGQRDDRPLVLKTVLESSLYQPRERKPPRGPEVTFWESKAELHFSHLKRIHQREGQEVGVETLKLESDRWVHFTIGPKETVRLQWIVKAPVTVRNCTLPESRQENFSWLEEGVSCPDEVVGDLRGLFSPGFNVLKLICSRKEVRRFQSVQQTWKLRSARIEGKWRKEVRIAYPYVSEEDLMAFPVVSDSEFQPELWKVQSESVVKTEQVGRNWVKPSAQYSCQGVFR
ncbi:MAG: hypothetical protein ACO3A2_03510 [Bdellovibrionia bacterium]